VIEELLLPHRAMPVEQFVDKVGGSTLDEPHNLGQARQPSFFVLEGCEEQVRVSWHHHHCVQIDSRAMLAQTALED